MLISRKGHTDTIQVYSVTVMTHVKALQAGHSSQGTSEPITPATFPGIIQMFYNCGGERQTFACRILTPINACLPHLARVCRYRARVHRLPACCCRLVAWYGAELERDGMREASLRYGTADTPSSGAVP